MYEHTIKETSSWIYTLYLEGKSEQDIRIITGFDNELISNVIDCCNNLYV